MGQTDMTPAQFAKIQADIFGQAAVAVRAVRDRRRRETAIKRELRQMVAIAAIELGRAGALALLADLASFVEGRPPKRTRRRLS